MVWIMGKKETIIAKITGEDVMDKLEDIHNELTRLTIQVKLTNGAVKDNRKLIDLNRKLIYSAFGGIVILTGWFITYLINSIV